MPEQVIAIPAFQDNYLWLLVDPDKRLAAVVDPGDAAAVQDKLDQLGFALESILLTHHHQDHTGGVSELVARWSCPVYGPESDNMPWVTKPVREGDSVFLSFSEHPFLVFDVPGHTAEHIAYYGNHRLFCGDTLFAGGCGRLLGGTAQQLHASLKRLAALPESTDIYCAHEYTEHNLRFALSVDPDNYGLHRRLEEVRRRRERGLSTVPSTLGDELKTNPFLRCSKSAVRKRVSQASGLELLGDVAVFAAMRKLKDHF